MRTTTTVACYITFYNALAGRPRRVIDTRPALGRADGRRSKLVAPADDDSHIIIIIIIIIITYVPVAREYIILLLYYFMRVYITLSCTLLQRQASILYWCMMVPIIAPLATNTHLSVDILLLYTYTGR